MRRQGASIFIYLIFGLLIAIFVININPGQKGDSGCGTASNTAVSVAGAKVNRSSYKIAYSNQFNWARGGRGREHLALDTLIRRELLVKAASEHGIRVSGELVDEEIKKGYFFTFVPPPPGQQFQWPVSPSGRVQLGENVFDTHDDGTKTWNFKKWKQWVGALDVTPGTYREEQERAMQAALIADLLMASVRVSKEEALAEFLFEGNTVTYDTVAFDPAKYRAAMKLTDADTERFLKTHEDDVKAKYKAEAATYKGTSQQLKLREIFIAKAEPPPAEPEKKPDEKKPEPAAGSGSGSGSAAPPPKKEEKKPEPPKPVGLPIEEAKTKLEAARTAITGGKQKFADAAKTLSSDEQLKNSSGDIGWHKASDAQLGDKALNDAVKALKPGDVTPVIATEKGVYLFAAEDKREGDLSYDQVKLEIAGELARDVWSKEAAKRAALDAIALAKKENKPLDQMFEKDLELTPSQRRRLEQQIREQMQKQGAGGGDDHGALEVIERDTPAAWKADKDGSSAAAGSGSGSAATPAKAPPPAPKVITASGDQLPAFADVAKPKAQKHGPTPRVPELEGLPKDAVPVVFDELRANQVSDKVFESEGNFVIVGLAERGQPKMEEFDKNADRVLADLRELRARMLIEDFLKTRCEELQKENKIKPAAELVRETDDQGNPLPTTYKPCSSFVGP